MRRKSSLGRRITRRGFLAGTLQKAGAKYEQGPKWGAFVVKDGNLPGGQNPASTVPLAVAVIAALR